MDLNEQSLKQEFLTEAVEMLDDVEAAFIQFEKNPSQEVIDRIFRLAHTIKGSALSVGFEHLGGFAHIVEALLSKLRGQEMQTTPEITDVLLRSNDALRTYVNLLRQDISAAMDTTSLADEIRLLIEDAGGQVQGVLGGGGGGFGFFDDEPDAAPATGDNAPAQYSPLWGRRIPHVMVLDDEAEFRDITTDRLKAMRVRVTICTDAFEALEHLKKSRVDLIIADVRLESMSGEEFFGRIPSGQQHIPVIFYSGHVAPHDVQRLMDLGAFDFLAKPAHATRFHAAVQNALRGKYFSDAVVKLSTLNFKGYLAMQKIMRALEGKIPPAMADEQKNLETFLDQIGGITNHLIHPDHRR